MSYLRFNHLAYADEDPAELEARDRRERMAAYDRLPPAVRAAMRECEWDIHILFRLGKLTDPAPLVERIRAIRSERDAVAFNASHTR